MFPNKTAMEETSKPHCNAALIQYDSSVRLLEGQHYDGAGRTVSPHAVNGRLIWSVTSWSDGPVKSGAMPVRSCTFYKLNPCLVVRRGF